MVGAPGRPPPPGEPMSLESQAGPTAPQTSHGASPPGTHRRDDRKAGCGRREGEKDDGRGGGRGVSQQGPDSRWRWRAHGMA